MSRKSLFEWCEGGPEHEGYARSIVQEKNVVFATMIPVPEGERFLGPLFGGNYGLVTVTDNRNYPALQVETVGFAEWIDREARSASTIGRDLLKAADMNTSREYLTGRYRNKTYEPVPLSDKSDSFRFSVPNALPGSPTLDHPFLLRQIFADAHLGGVEMVSLFASLVEKVPSEELLPMVLAWKARIEERIRFDREHDRPASVSVERPYRLIFRGTDDYSYGRAFSSVEEADRVVDEIAASCTEENVRRLLVFTN